MKRLVCELCGGVDLVKSGDFFVCQSCGVKYTKDVARKILDININTSGYSKRQIENFTTSNNTFVSSLIVNSLIQLRIERIS